MRNTIMALTFVVALVVGAQARESEQEGLFAYVPENGSQDVAVVNLSTNKVIAHIPVPGFPAEIALTPNHAYAYVTSQGTSTVTVIKTSNNSVVTTFGVGSEPFGVAVTPDGTKAYVVNEFGFSVAVISTATNSILNFIPVGSYPTDVAITADNRYVYVSNLGDNTISVIDTTTNAYGGSVVNTISVPATGGPSLLAITPDGSTLLVAGGNPSVTEISLPSNTVTNTVSIGTEAPTGLGVSPDAKSVWISAFPASNYLSPGSVMKLELATNTLSAPITLGTVPEFATVSPNGRRVYITNFRSNTMSVLDADTGTLVATVNMGSFPENIVFVHKDD